MFICFSTIGVAKELLHGPISNGSNVNINHGQVVVYRVNGENIEKTPVILINNNVIGALLPGEYVQTRTCSSSIGLRVASRGELINKGNLKSIKISNESITYIKIIEDKDKSFFPMVVDELQGKSEVNTIQVTSNIVNRYIPKLVLNGDSLFKFDSSELSLPSLNLLDRFIHEISMCPNQAKNLKIVGHTDRLGSETYNEKLSLKRAQAVADYLIKNGINIPMKVEGFGSKEPLTKDCKGDKSPILVQCLQPDRRVVIDY
jgi:outer membrane protein OmpA-like peptidoglycan-associated protein